MNTRLPGLLLILNALLLAALAWLWLGPGAQARRTWTAPDPVKPDLAAESDAAARLGGLQAAQLTATLERPLFDASRRPGASAPESTASAPPAAGQPQVQLLGVYTASGVTGVLARVDGKVRRIGVGGTVSGDWRLAEVRAREIVLRRGDERHVVKLVPAVGTPGAAAPAVASPAPAMPSPLRIEMPPPGVMPPPMPPGAGAAPASPWSSGGRTPSSVTPLASPPLTPGPGSAPAGR